MITTIPPAPPALVATGGNGESQRLKLRFQRIVLSAATIVATAWCMTLGPVPAILALAVAKHVLVAILVMGCDSVESAVQ
jgi:hypothetical protein